MTRYTYIMASLGSASLKLGVKLLCILIGILASEKSTFIHSFKSYLESTESNLNLICVSLMHFFRGILYVKLEVLLMKLSFGKSIEIFCENILTVT